MSYVWHSAVAPDLSQVQAPQGWKEIVNNRTPALLFMIWPQELQRTHIWLHSPKLLWEAVEIGDEFVHDEGEWKRNEGPEQCVYVLKVQDCTAKLIRKETDRRYSNTRASLCNVQFKYKCA